MDSPKKKVPDDMTPIASLKWNWAGHIARMIDDRLIIGHLILSLVSSNISKPCPSVNVVSFILVK